MADDEVALDIEETNRLRAKLGLKPLNTAPANAAKPKPQAPKEPKAADPEELRAKLTAAREKRRRETELRQTRTLGEADDDVDDVANWIQKIKPGQQEAAEDPAAAAKPSKRQRRAAAAAAAAAASGSDGEEHTAADLAGIAVRHDVDELVEGETVVLTLADTGILDEKGNLADGPDQLIDTLAQQEKARRKARAAAGKTAKPLWEEDGKVRGLLDKYDEEEEEAVAAFDASGQLAAQQRRQQELHDKLAAGAALLHSVDGSSKAAAATGDYYTPEEAAALKGGDKKKKKKRKLRTTKVEDEDAGGLDLDALEAAAAAESAANLGSREARELRQQQQEQARAAAAAERAARFEAALGRANVASEALRQQPGGSRSRSDLDLDADEADDELAASLARARRLASKAAATANGSSSNGQDAAATDGVAAAADGGDGGLSFQEIARQLAKKREEDEAKLREQIALGTVEAFTETTEFVRSIQVEQPRAADDGSYMDVDEQPSASAAAPTPLPPPPVQAAAVVKAPRQRNLRKGGWTTVEGEDEQQNEQQGDGANGEQQHRNKRPAPELEDTGVVGERAMGKGLAATLALLKDKGALKDKIQWSGRTNDKKPVALIGLHDVYTGGSHEESMAQRIEVALTQKDEFGRVMTPKERFRVMCHQFHGMAPSKNKQEERQRKYLEEVAIAQATSSENPSANLDKLKELQKATGTAYIPLTGKLKPGAAAGGKDPLSGLASARMGTAATPVLGGGLTPLAGNKKVEIMLGISKGSGSMPPPAPRR